MVWKKPITVNPIQLASLNINTGQRTNLDLARSPNRWSRCSPQSLSVSTVNPLLPKVSLLLLFRYLCSIPRQNLKHWLQPQSRTWPCPTIPIRFVSPWLSLRRPKASTRTTIVQISIHRQTHTKFDTRTPTSCLSKILTLPPVLVHALMLSPVPASAPVLTTKSTLLHLALHSQDWVLPIWRNNPTYPFCTLFLLKPPIPISTFARNIFWIRSQCRWRIQLV